VDGKKQKNFENSEDAEISYNERKIRISELTDEEKIDCLSKLWTYKETIENENEGLHEMIQKMYFFGKMVQFQEDSD